MSKFKVLENFMVRTPLMPIELYKKIYMGDNTEEEIKNTLNDKKVSEAITVASLSLKNSKRYLTSNDTKKKEQVISTSSRYLNRMTTRTTPYGLFAGVTLGEFSNKTTIKLNKSKSFKKIARPDMEWLYGVINELEKNQDVLNELLIKTNPLIVKKGSRLEIPYISNFGQVNDILTDNVTATIRKSIQVEKVIKLSKNFIKYKDLIQIMLDKNPGVTKEVLEKFINQLIKNEYIMTELRPQLSNVDIFQFLLAKLQVSNLADGKYKELYQISDMLKEYNSLEIGEGEELYLEIINKMKAIKDCKNLIQIDMKVNDEKFYLDNSIANDLEQVLDFAYEFSNEISFDHLEEYMEDFGEVYGYDREVRLLEVLDSDLGLGAPAGYTKPISNRYLRGSHLPKENKIKNMLNNKLLEACKINSKEIILTDDDLKITNSKDFNDNECPSSLEIYTMIRRDKNNNYRIHLSPAQGSVLAGKTFGRFGHILPSSFKRHLKNINKLESENNKDYIFAELIELPQNGRLSNVSINCNERDYELNVATYGSDKKIQLDIDDIYVGLEHVNGKNNMYFKSRKFGKRIKFSATNALNYHLYSNVSKFLIEVSMLNKRNVFNLFYNTDFEEFVYNPAVRYKNIIITPAKWILSKEILGDKTDKESIDKKLKKFNEWKNKWDVPKLVYLKESDNRLLFNLNNEFHVKELISNLYKENKEKLVLTEFEDSFDDMFVEGNDGKYAAEFVFPIVRNYDDTSLIENNKKDVIENNNLEYLSKSIKENDETYSKDRTFILGDEWIYFKIYGMTKRKEDFLCYHLNSLCRELINEDYIEKFFFIRYFDPEFHIRVRFKIKDKNKLGPILEKINKWGHSLIEEGLTKKIVFDSYYRELERYGGIKLIEEAENIFYKDSIYDMELIKEQKVGNIKLHQDKVMILNIINIMTEMGMDFNSQKELFYKYFDKERYRKDFQKDRRELMKLANNSNNWNNLREIEGGQALYNLFSLTKNELKIFYKKMLELESAGELANNRDEIILSIIHMHCNRMGLSRTHETYIMQLIRHTLQSLEYIYKNKI